MAATAYAALVSMMNIISRYQHHTCPVPFHKLQMQALLEKAALLVEFLEDYYSQTTTTKGSIQSLETRMTIAANAAEDMIESSYVDRLLKRKAIHFYPDMHQTLVEMDQLVQQTMYFGVKKQKTDPQIMQRSYDVTGKKSKSIMVGFDDQLRYLMDRMTLHNPSRQIIPIVGMGGIGKTTLARHIYDHPYVGRSFDRRAWVTISQHYVVKDIILAILRDINVYGNDQMDDEDLGDLLHKGLWRRKYFIVLDDVWSKEAWNAIRRFLPDNKNQSIVFVTTRLGDVASSLGSSSSSTHEMKVLDENKSFDLLSETIYGKDDFPPELESLGKEIAGSCKGLPLAIVVIGGLLKMSPKTAEHWANIAKNVSSSITTQDDGYCLEILSVSYNHLPVHLKSCFLYMAGFKEDADISIPNLIKLWISDGIIKPTADTSFEDVAREYLDDLLSRNIIMLQKWAKHTPTWTMHDLLREFCWREAEKEKFLCICITDDDRLKLPEKLETERRVVYHSYGYGFVTPSPTYVLPPMPYVRSVVGSTWEGPQFACFELLRALYVNKSGFRLPADFLQLVNIRHLNIASRSDLNMLLPSLSLFWNLERLWFAGRDGSSEKLILPREIWELPNLRDIDLHYHVILPDPMDGQLRCVLTNLHRIVAEDFYCTDEVIRRIPNLRQLRTTYNSDSGSKLSHCFANLAHLSKLETLDVTFMLYAHVKGKCAFSITESLTFSSNLRVLSLSCSRIPWENMTLVGSLPYLEELTLDFDAFWGEEWNSNEGEFNSLTSLSISCCNLQYWRAESSHFPKLEYLSLFEVELNEIPSGIGDIASLETIVLNTRDMSTVISAKEIIEEQHQQGNDDLVIKGFFKGKSNEEKTELEEWAEANSNFQIEFEVDPMAT